MLRIPHFSRSKSKGTVTARRKANPRGNSGTVGAVIWKVVVVAAELDTGGPPLGFCVAKFQHTTTW